MPIPRLIVLETLQGLGRPGLAGALLLFAALVYGLAWVLPAGEEVTRLQERNARAEEAWARVRQEDDTPSRPPAAPEDVYQALPAQAEVVSWVEHIYNSAAKAQLSLIRGEYILAPVADTRLVRYQIFLPVRGDYGRIRRFLANALATVPGLGLEDFSLKRQAIGDPEVEALIRFSLYLAKP